MLFEVGHLHHVDGNEVDEFGSEGLILQTYLEVGPILRRPGLTDIEYPKEKIVCYLPHNSPVLV